MEDTHFIDKEPNRYEALAELQKEQIQSMNEDQIIEIVRKFEIFWDLQTEDYKQTINDLENEITLLNNQ